MGDGQGERKPVSPGLSHGCTGANRFRVGGHSHLVLADPAITQVGFSEDPRLWPRTSLPMLQERWQKVLDRWSETQAEGLTLP